MSSQQILSHRENAEVYTGDAICKQKSIELLEKINLPTGLLPLDDIVEVGYNESSGFVWLKQKKSKTHVFRAIGRSVWYDTEVTAFVQDRRMKRLTGVKSKEILIWVTISDISIQDPSSGKITFGTPSGISRSFPVSAFEKEEEDKPKTVSEMLVGNPSNDKIKFITPSGLHRVYPINSFEPSSTDKLNPR